MLEDRFRLFKRVGYLEIGGRNIVMSHELFRKNLAALKLGGGFRRAKNLQIPLLKLIHDAKIERNFRPYYRQIDVHTGGEVGNFHNIGSFNRNAIGNPGNPRISRSAKQFRHHR